MIKPWFLKHYYKDQPKRSGFELMQKAFVDSDGNIYYVPKNDFDYPVKRSKELQKRLIRVNSGLSEETLDLFFDAMRKALGRGKNPDISRIGFLIEEMALRKEILIDIDLFFDILALKYIREDENPALVDLQIHKQKIEQFTKDSEGGLYDFFYKMGLITLIPYLKKSEDDWTEYMEQSIARMKAHETHLKTYLTGHSLQS
jgi:hypothetical protein